MRALPLLVLLLPLLSAPVLWLVRSGAARRWLWIAVSALSLLAAAAQAVAVATQGPIMVLRGELLVDGLAALMALLIAFLALACAVYAASYLPAVHPADAEREAMLQRRLPLFQALFQVLQGTVLWVVMTNNIVLLWVALEATTLASALLVSFYWDGRAIEAGYKYLLLLTVGITAAFFGCVLLYSAAAPHLGASSALLISNLRSVAPLIPSHIGVLATVLLLIGFGTKAGLVPFHPWVADAHAEAPAVMSAFLSGIIIKVPFIGMLRVWRIMGPLHPELNTALLWLGAVTITVGAFLALGQDDIKRLHAYSSVSQVGYIALALGTGTELGYAAAVLFLVSHALTKGLLFLTAGSVMSAAHGVRSLSQLGGLGKRLPVTAACALAGALSLAGLPPFSGFAAKATVLFAAASAREWWPFGIAVVMSLVTAAYMVGMAQRVFRGAPSAGVDPGTVREVPASMRVAMLMLAGAMLLVGLAPQLLDALLAAPAVIAAGG
ncbi:MAG: complex I subunit 5 family protein [Gemmatimonadaceae bacterium]